MMVSITRFWRNLLLNLIVAGWLSLTAQAGEIGINNPALSLVDDGYALSASFTIDFGPRLEEALNKGVALIFVVDFELTRPRWYWFDSMVVRKSQSWRLSYHTLTRQYRLSSGALHQNFATLEEALRILARLRNWYIVGQDPIKADTTYEAALRMYLDLKQLPQLFQVAAFSNSEWNLSSGWTHWNWTPSGPPAATPATTPMPGTESK